MEFEFMSASEARKLMDVYGYAVKGSPIAELKNSINTGINQKAQSGETSHRVYLSYELPYSGIFVDGRDGQEEVLRDIIEDLQSLGFYVDEIVDRGSLEIECLVIYW